MYNTAYFPDRPGRPRRYRLLGIICALLVVAIIVLLFAMTPPAAPPGVPDGEKIYEGGRDLEAVALSGAEIQPTATGLTLTLSFTGWTSAGETVPIQSIPQLTVTRYQNPERLAVTVPDLADWSAIADLTLPRTPNVRIEGVFCVDRTLYWQLTGPVAVSLSGQGGSLALTLEPASRQQQPGWVVLADAVDRIEYVPLLGSLMQSGFSPVRCADGGTVIMQSKRFTNKSDAAALERKTRALCEAAGTPASVRVEYLNGDRLPQANSYPGDEELSRLFDGAQAEMLMRDAIILSKAEKSPTFFVKRANGALLTLGETGAREALPMQHIPGALRAALSPGASYVALATDIGDLQIINVRTGRAEILNETTPNETELRVETTETFAWFGETTLAVMMGDPLRFLSVDAALPLDEPDAIRRIDPYPGVEGEMTGTADRLFLLDKRRILYRITPSDASRAAIGLAERFAVSPDGTLAVMMNGDEQGATLIANDLNTWRETLIGVGLPVVDICAVDSGTVYILMKESDGYRLYRYSVRFGGMTALARLPESRLYTSESPNALIVNSLGADGVWSVYRLRFGG
ncbi:MAG: hypothetical protein LBB86_11025 [Oscillospiraceae bacterium]|nr:hypothetical protein [Oscillospiraceae bacterium]